MSGTGDQTTQANPDGDKVSNPREIQGTIALVAVLGFIVMAGAVVVADVIRGVDPTSALGALSPLATAVVAFYFGSKAAAGAAASTT